MVLLTFLLFLLMGPQTQAPTPSKPPEFNSVMMDSTFRVFGPAKSKPDLISTGTGFLIGRLIPQEPGRAYYVLVTAAHVLNDIQGDTATLVLRIKTPTAQYQRAEHKVSIRKGATKLWTQHPTADVAVMYVDLPDNLSTQLLLQDFLAADADFLKYEFHPGDEVFTVGYPYGYEVNNLGFPVLRSGRIASYPLTPAAEMKSFKVDFSVFGGNSGGPIYINQLGRPYGGTYHIDERVFRVLGVVTDQVTVTATGEHLNVAGVVYAQFISEAIALLPPNPPKVR